MLSGTLHQAPRDRTPRRLCPLRFWGQLERVPPKCSCGCEAAWGFGRKFMARFGKPKPHESSLLWLVSAKCNARKPLSRGPLPCTPSAGCQQNPSRARVYSPSRRQRAGTNVSALGSCRQGNTSRPEKKKHCLQKEMNHLGLEVVCQPDGSLTGVSLPAAQSFICFALAPELPQPTAGRPFQCCGAVLGRTTGRVQ